MVRDERWKPIEYNANGARSTQLFDLQNDPDELHNPVPAPNRLEQLAPLRALLSNAQKQLGDPRPPFTELPEPSRVRTR